MKFSVLISEFTPSLAMNGALLMEFTPPTDGDVFGGSVRVWVEI